MKEIKKIIIFGLIIVFVCLLIISILAFCQESEIIDSPCYDRYGYEIENLNCLKTNNYYFGLLIEDSFMTLFILFISFLWGMGLFILGARIIEAMKYKKYALGGVSE